MSRLTLNLSGEVRPTFHYLMVKKIMEKLPNAYENHYTKEPQYVDGYRPDIIARKAGAVKRMRNDTDYDPIWDKHLLEELRKEIAHWSSLCQAK